MTGEGHAEDLAAELVALKGDHFHIAGKTGGLFLRTGIQLLERRVREALAEGGHLLFGVMEIALRFVGTAAVEVVGVDPAAERFFGCMNRSMREKPEEAKGAEGSDVSVCLLQGVGAESGDDLGGEWIGGELWDAYRQSCSR